MKIKKTRNKYWIVVSSIVLLVLVIGIGYWYLNHGSNNTKTDSGQYNPSTNVPVSNSKEGQSSSGITSSKNGDNNTTTPLSSTVNPSTPLGTFVSNHYPNLSGSPSPNIETSTCTTTPGAKCQIRFTQNNVIKYLPLQTTDANGNTNWSSWKLQDIGLTEGSWKVSAIATNGSKQSVANDSINLEVAK